jgi:hypothetical protein
MELFFFLKILKTMLLSLKKTWMLLEMYYKSVYISIQNTLYFSLQKNDKFWQILRV